MPITSGSNDVSDFSVGKQDFLVQLSQGPPLKFGMAQNVQHSARFLAIFDFDWYQSISHILLPIGSK